MFCFNLKIRYVCIVNESSLVIKQSMKPAGKNLDIRAIGSIVIPSL